MKCPNCEAENLSDSRFCHSCAAPLKESGAKTIKAATFEISRGALFAGRYEILEELGQGGMGKVFKVYDHKVNEIIALKLIRPEIGVNEKAIERFKNELKVARKIAHRNICRMFDLGEEGYYHYITMEFVAGEDLKRFIRRAGSLTSGKAVHIARQVTEGLSEAHRLGVIHRDLKPQNIMIDQDGDAKIMDFGIARFVDTDRMTGSGVMIGTPEYMSPEQAELADVDKRADIYSLGIVLYEMVTGKVPFEGATPLGVAMKHKTEKARNVRELNAQVSVALADIIAKCMEKDREKRFASAEELKKALDGVEQDLTTGERVVPRKKERRKATEVVAVKPAKKKNLIIPAAAAGLLAVAAIVIFVVLPKKENPPLSSSPAAATETPAEVQQKSQPVPPPSEVKTETKAGESKPTPKEDPQETAKKPAVKSEVKTEPQKTTAEQQKTPAAPPKTSLTEAETQLLNLAQARMTAARSQAQKAGLSEKILFFKLAEAAAKEGQKNLAPKNWVDGRCRFAVSENLFRLSIAGGKDEDQLKALKKLVSGQKDRADKARKDFQGGDKLFESALESEKQGEEFQTKNDLENAGKAFAQASFLYEKIIFSAQTAKDKPSLP